MQHLLQRRFVSQARVARSTPPKRVPVIAPQVEGKIFAKVPSPTHKPSEIVQSRLKLALSVPEGSVYSVEQAQKYLISGAKQEFAFLSATELTQTLWAFQRFANVDSVQLELCREIFGRNPNEFSGDEVVQILDVLKNAAPDRPVENVRKSFVEDLKKRDARSFSTKSLLFLYPATVDPIKREFRTEKVIRALCTRKDLKMEDVIMLLEMNPGTDSRFNAHLTALFSKRSGKLDKFSLLPFRSLLTFQFDNVSEFSEKFWDHIVRHHVAEFPSHVLDLLRLLPYTHNLAYHDKVVSNLTEAFFLKASHKELVDVLCALVASKSSSTSQVFPLLKARLDTIANLFVDLPLQCQALKTLNSSSSSAAAEEIKSLFLSKSAFSKVKAVSSKDRPWEGRVDYKSLGEEDLKEIKLALTGNKAYEEVLALVEEALGEKTQK